MRKMVKVVHKYNLDEQPKEYEFWLNQPPHLRLEAVEEIIREYHQWQVGNEPRLQRVYSIVKQS